MHSNCGISLRQHNIDASMHCLFSPPLSTASPRAKIVSSFGSNTSILENTNASLECSFGGIPIPSMFWYQNGVAVSDRPIRALRVSGVYQCLISNQYDTIISTIVICVQSESKDTLEGRLVCLFKAATSWIGNYGGGNMDVRGEWGRQSV